MTAVGGGSKGAGPGLEGGVAMVTGAGRGFGLTVATRLAEAGAAVCLVARTARAVEAAADAINRAGGVAMALTADVTDRDAVEGAFARTEADLGAVSVLVNNAGTLDTFGPLWESDPDAWWRDVEVHVRGTLLCSHIALTDMVERKSGRIVNVVGMLGQRGEPYATAYAAAKAAIFRLTGCLADELSEHHVRVFSMSPGPVLTEMTRRLIETDEGRRWLPGFSELSEPEWVSPDRGAELVVRLARGDADALSGRYVHVSQDLDDLIRRAGEIISSDRLTMRVIS